MISTISPQNKTLTVYYGNDSTKVVNIANSDSIIIFICGVSKVSYGGKDYNTVLIGSQCWLKENLDIGTMISGTSNQLDNSILEKYCYNNNPLNCTNYGGLYQWSEAMQYVTTDGAQGICPIGWHLPTYLEYQTLKTYVNNSGNALKEIGQGIDGGAGTNTSGFSALLAGARYLDGSFANFGIYAHFWSSTELAANLVGYLFLHRSNNSINLDDELKDYGFSVRCLKD
jgi:uncharacterized protein (TIGR02145 family)